jgi:hypothetical protein
MGSLMNYTFDAVQKLNFAAAYASCQWSDDRRNDDRPAFAVFVDVTYFSPGRFVFT